jgi:hypothetical protein
LIRNRGSQKPPFHSGNPAGTENACHSENNKNGVKTPEGLEKYYSVIEEQLCHDLTGGPHLPAFSAPDPVPLKVSFLIFRTFTSGLDQTFLLLTCLFIDLPC